VGGVKRNFWGAEVTRTEVGRTPSWLVEKVGYPRLHPSTPRGSPGKPCGLKLEHSHLRKYCRCSPDYPHAPAAPRLSPPQILGPMFQFSFGAGTCGGALRDLLVLFRICRLPPSQLRSRFWFVFGMLGPFPTAHFYQVNVWIACPFRTVFLVALCMVAYNPSLST